uniref:Uncharacterized protein n=1 Tax=Romanomermis culicivorax TaxID=13658 RepID=A0A915KWQ9_ROMCU
MIMVALGFNVLQEKCIWKANYGLSLYMLKGFLGGAVAVPPLGNVGVGVTSPTRAQQKSLGLGPVDWL